MSRKKSQPKKNIVPDPKFNSTIIPKLINNQKIVVEASFKNGFIHGICKYFFECGNILTKLNPTNIKEML